VDAAHEICPTVDRKALGKAFGQIDEQNLELEACETSITGVRAVASCDGTARYVPKSGPAGSESSGDTGDSRFAKRMKRTNRG
jgi:hypothetical protein